MGELPVRLLKRCVRLGRILSCGPRALQSIHLLDGLVLAITEPNSESLLEIHFAVRIPHDCSTVLMYVPTCLDVIIRFFRMNA